MIRFHYPQHLRKAQIENIDGSKDCLEETTTGPFIHYDEKANGMSSWKSLTVKQG